MRPPTPAARLLDPVPENLSSRIEKALAILQEAHECARELGSDAWDFAVEIGYMRGEGISPSLLRWLVCHGYATHLVEEKPQGTKRRCFRPGEGLRFAEATCFVLTADGLQLIQRHKAPEGSLPHPFAVAGPHDVRVLRGMVPRWDGLLRELRVGNCLVKQFRQPAPNQEMILAAFQEEGWPPRIDDPLPPKRERDAKQDLHTTIQNLNRHQRTALIRFNGDGNGCGVCWKLIPSNGAHRDNTELL